MIDGTCEPEAFAPARLKDPRVHALAARVKVLLDDNPDVNALWPQHFVIELRDGRRWERRLATPIGHPENPLSRERCLTKFRKCWAIGGLSPGAADGVISLIDGLETCPDVARLPEMLAR